jgi:hypothetical protein
MGLPQNADLVLYEPANLVLEDVLADRSQPPTLNSKLRPPQLRFFIILYMPQEDIFVILSPQAFGISFDIQVWIGCQLLLVVFVLLGSGRVLHEVPRELVLVLCDEIGDTLLHLLGDCFLLL